MVMSHGLITIYRNQGKHMFDNMKETIDDWNDDEEIKSYLRGILDKRLYDKSGLIYG